MNKAAGWLVAGALIVVLTVAVIVSRSGPSGGPSPAGGNAPSQAQPTMAAPAGAVEISIASSNTKQKWMDEVVKAFNAKQQRTASGKAIFARVEHVSTGESMEAIIGGKSKPTIWSPADRFWLELLNSRWRDSGHNDTLADTSAPASVTSPLVVAMWRPMAQAIGWPQQPIGWKTIFDLATDPSGWGKYNHPEWGKFRLAHGHGELANSGRLSLLSQVYAATGKTRGLTGDDLRSAQTVEFVSRIQDAIVSYGPSDKYLLDRMAERGPGQLSAVVTYEANVALYNEDNASRLSFPLVAIYPTEGTFWTEHPFAVLHANWVSDEQAKAAQAFVEFALSDEQLGSAPSFGLRAATENLPLTAPLDDAHGVVPQINRDQVKPLVPLPTNLDAALHDLWVTAKKKAVVVLAVDTSGSMSGAKIKGAREGAVAFLDAMADNDEIIFIPFSDNVTISPRSGRVGDVREELRQEMQSLIEKGNTALHETTITSLTKIQEARAKYGEQRLYSVVLLTDGQNTKSPPQWSQVVEALPTSPEAAGTRIISIAYGGDADLNVLNTLATRTGGEMYKASATDIKGVYLKAAQY